MKIGILTGGGDTASLNAIIYGAAETTELYNHKLVGFKRGWAGVLTPAKYQELRKTQIIPSAGGTLLKTSRTNLDDATLQEAADNIVKIVDALIAIGGDDTLTIGKRLLEKLKIPICFITKTIDNDVGRNAPEGKFKFEDIVNYYTSGFATAAYKAASYASDLRTTAYSHERIMFLETMGRTSGWLALSSYKGMPDFILVPEVALDFERFKEKLIEKYKEKGYAVVVVPERIRYKGWNLYIGEDENDTDDFGHKRLGGVAQILAEKIKIELGIENSNYVNLNYLYRSGSPTLFEKQQAMALGKISAKTVIGEITGQVAVIQRHGGSIVAETKPIDNVLLTDKDGKIIPRNLDLRFYDAENYCITDLGREYFGVIK